MIWKVSGVQKLVLYWNSDYYQRDNVFCNVLDDNPVILMKNPFLLYFSVFYEKIIDNIIFSNERINNSFMLQKELSLMIQLAIADNELAEREEKLIYNLGKLNGVSEEEIKKLIKNPLPIGPIEALSNDEKFQYLYMVIQMMKVDGQIFKSEIEFCRNLAEKLGFKRSVVAELSSKIYSDPSITSDREALKKTAFRYLK